MYEQSDRYALIERILDHGNNRGRDAHEVRDLSRRLKEMSFAELGAEMRRLNH